MINKHLFRNGNTLFDYLSNRLDIPILGYSVGNDVVDILPRGISDWS